MSLVNNVNIVIETNTNLYNYSPTEYVGTIHGNLGRQPWIKTCKASIKITSPISISVQIIGIEKK